jgi:hypothetical protein
MAFLFFFEGPEKQREYEDMGHTHEETRRKRMRKHPNDVSDFAFLKKMKKNLKA